MSSLLFQDVSTIDEEMTDGSLEFADLTGTTVDSASLNSTSPPITQNYRCCDSNCLATIPQPDAQLLQRSFNSCSRINQQQFIVDILAASGNEAQIINLKSFSLLGRRVCRDAFTKLIGVSKKRLQNIQRTPRHDLRASMSIRVHKKSG